jgi:hypothetical protein
MVEIMLSILAGFTYVAYVFISLLQAYFLLFPLFFILHSGPGCFSCGTGAFVLVLVATYEGSERVLRLAEAVYWVFVLS